MVYVVVMLPLLSCNYASRSLGPLIIQASYATMNTSHQAPVAIRCHPANNMGLCLIFDVILVLSTKDIPLNCFFYPQN